MEKWEYMVVSVNAQTSWRTGLGLQKPELPNEELQSQLNRWGEAGWECVSLVADEWRGDITGHRVSSYHAIFKRRKP